MNYAHGKKIPIGGDMIEITGDTTLTTTPPIVGSIAFPSDVAISTMARSASQVNLLDKYEMNHFVVQHKLTAQEYMTLQTVDTNFADHIKHNITKTTATKIIDKMSFTRSTSVGNDTITVRGRIWVFTKEELNQLIQDAKNA